MSPEAPSAGYLMSETPTRWACRGGVQHADRRPRSPSSWSATRVQDQLHRIDRGGRRIAGLCGERIALCTLELGGKSAAVVPDETPTLDSAAIMIAAMEWALSGQVCASLTRIVVPRNRHDEFTDARDHVLRDAGR